MVEESSAAIPADAPTVPLRVAYGFIQTCTLLLFVGMSWFAKRYEKS